MQWIDGDGSRVRSCAALCVVRRVRYMHITTGDSVLEHVSQRSKVALERGLPSGTDTFLAAGRREPACGDRLSDLFEDRSVENTFDSAIVQVTTYHA